MRSYPEPNDAVKPPPGGWTALSWALLRRRTLARVERNLTDGRVAL